MTKKQIMAKIDKDQVVSSKLIKSNTVEYITNTGTRIIRYYETNILIFHYDGILELNSGGYKTVSTKSRINEFSPVTVYQRDRKWYICVNNHDISFRDGMLLSNQASLGFI